MKVWRPARVSEGWAKTFTMQKPDNTSPAEIARQAIGLPEQLREAFIRSACGENRDLLSRTRTAITTMLSATLAPGAPSGITQRGDGPELGEEVPESDAHGAPTIYGVASTSADLFESGPANGHANGSPGAGDAPVRSATLPETIGTYRVLGVLGEGGMGMVYLAEQERPKRTVALKVVRPGMLSGPMLRRFELESQVLGRLQHPGIAQVFEAGMAVVGAAASGNETRAPFFAMEYVRGQTLTEYASVRRLSVLERLELMAKVCDAVQHAHSRGVIHRDLKPGNILVTAEGLPKVLDFGIARATDSDIKATMQTDVGQLVGTLPYMSPEQVAGDAGALDTRSDVYTLGVILYELLAGRLPLDVAGRTIVEAARTITQDEPRKLGDDFPELRGDISTIVAKAMEKDRERRYKTASEFAADIERHRRSEPIAARPPTTVYQLKKFAVRNKGLVVGASAAVILLILGVVGTSIGMARAIEQRVEADEQRRVADAQRERADLEAESAKAVNDFLVNRLLMAATPEESQGRQVTVAEVLGKSAGEIDEAFKDRPALKARLYSVVGKTYSSLGDYASAEKYFQGAISVRREIAPGSSELASSLHDLGSLRFRQSRWKEAADLFEETTTLFEAANLGKEAIESRASSAACLRNLGDLPAAEKLQRQVIELATEKLGTDHATTLSSITNLAIVLHDAGRVEEAKALYQQVVDTRKRVLGNNHPSTLMALGNLATAYFDLGDIQGAEKVLAESLEIRKVVSGPDHPDTILHMSNLAVVREKLGHVEEADKLYRETLEIAIRKLGPENESVAVLMSNLASNLALQKKHEEAKEFYLKAIAILTKINGPEHAETLQSELGYGRWLLGREQIEDAAQVIESVLAKSTARFGADYPTSIGASWTLANIRDKQGRPADALPLAEKALAGRTQLLGAEHPSTKETKAMVDRLRSGG